MTFGANSIGAVGQSQLPIVPEPAKYIRGPSLDEVLDGKGVLALGHECEAIRTLKIKINAAGYRPKLEVTSLRYGPLMYDAVAWFQRRNPPLSVDGVVGQNTARRLMDWQPPAVAPEPPPPSAPGPVPGRYAPIPPPPQTATPAVAAPETRAPLPAGSFAPAPGRAAAPFAATSADRVAQASQILYANNVQLEEGRIYAIQIDQDEPPAFKDTPEAQLTDKKARAAAQRENAKAREKYMTSYTGQMALFQAKQGPGGKIGLVELTQKKPLRSAGHPGQYTAAPGKFTDVDGNGVPDIAHLRAGVYDYHGRSVVEDDVNRFNSVKDSLPVDRDVDHDGVISQKERDASTRRGDLGTGIQIHPGNSTAPKSVGCQTIQADDFELFRKAIESQHVKTFTYVLVRRPQD